MWGRVKLVHGALFHPLGRSSVYLSVGGLVSAVGIPRHGFGY